MSHSPQCRTAGMNMHVFAEVREGGKREERKGERREGEWAGRQVAGTLLII